MKHEDYKEMLALHALHALDDESERRLLEAHLADCADCRAELDATRQSVASLAYAAPPVAPAPELRAQILARIKSEPQGEREDAGGRRASSGNGAATSTTTPTSPSTTTTSPASAASTVSNVSAPEEFARRREAREMKVSRRLFVFGTLAASLAIAALLVSLLLLWQRTARLQNEIAQLSANANQTAQELARTRADRQLLAAPEAHTATLAGTKMAARARARLTFDERTGRAMLMAADLPPAPAGKAYQLWFIAEGKPPMPGSVFQTDASGHAEMHDIVPPEGRRAAVFAVTLEPASGVSAPTGEMYLKSSAS
ncbi:MAG TPA: anti-sigma factor [Pyrinomonadaceae bacterium]|jgi:anti-sigma-K factor RskA|nr:anti-sigma factor [Pyrinomonadaceae bacterium]